MKEKLISFLRGVPADEALIPIGEALSKEYSEVFRKYGAAVFQYATPGVADFNGFIPLKQTLARRFGLQGDAQKRVICSNGGMEIFSLLLKSLPKGSMIATDALTYDRVLYDALNLGLRVVGVPLGQDGCDLEALRQTLQQNRIELFYHIGYHHNPTGLTTSHANLEAAAELCAESGVLYVLDVAYLELRYDGKKNRMIDLDRYAKTAAVVGSFTKTMSPGAKCGFGFFPEAVVEEITPVLANTRLNPNYPTQAAIHKIIESGFYDEHLDFLIRLYRPRMEAVNRALRSHFPEMSLPDVTGGFFFGIWLAGITDSSAFLAAAKERGVLLAPTQVFAPGWRERYDRENRGPYFRLTFPALTESENAEGVALIAETYRQVV